MALGSLGCNGGGDPEPRCESGVGQLQLIHQGGSSLSLQVSDEAGLLDEVVLDPLLTELLTVPVGKVFVSVVSGGFVVGVPTEARIGCDQLTSLIVGEGGILPPSTPAPTPGPVSTPSPVPGSFAIVPVADSSVEAGERLALGVRASGSTGAVFALVQAPAGMAITPQGELSWEPAYAQVGVHRVTVSARDPASGQTATSSFGVTVNPSVTLDQNVFDEGEVGDPLFSLRVRGGTALVSVSSNELWNAFTPLVADANGSEIRMSRVSAPVIQVPANDGDVLLDVSGAAKFARRFSLDITVRFAGGLSYTKTFDIEIRPLGLPYVRYDLFAVTAPRASGEDPASLLANVADMKLTYGGWRTPILMRYRAGAVTCGGAQLQYYDAGSTTHPLCLSELVSADAETVFLFDTVWIDGTQIGGIANGARHGAVVEAVAWSHAVAHELGHQLGLLHTFDSSSNPAVAHAEGGEFAFWSLVRPSRAEDTHEYPADFPGWIFTWNPLGTTADFVELDFPGVAHDTPLDPYNAFLTTLNNLDPATYSNEPYRNGDRVLLDGYQGEGSVCSQAPFDPARGEFPVSCSAESGLSVGAEVVNNVMGYWDRPVGASFFSPGQRGRMDRVLGLYPELTRGGN